MANPNPSKFNIKIFYIYTQSLFMDYSTEFCNWVEKI